MREAVEIGEAVEGNARASGEQARTAAALESARDFAAVASLSCVRLGGDAHEPDEVLSTLDLAPEQRQEVIGDVIRAQGQDRSDADRPGTACAGG